MDQPINDTVPYPLNAHGALINESDMVSYIYLRHCLRLPVYKYHGMMFNQVPGAEVEGPNGIYYVRLSGRFLHRSLASRYTNRRGGALGV